MQNEVLVGRYNGILAKLLSMKERAPSPIIGAELLPAVVLESDRPEFHFLGGTKLVMGSANQAAVAGELAAIIVNNPASSGILLVITRLFNRATGGLLLFGQTFTGTPTGTKSAVNHCDTRWGTTVVAGQHAGIAGQILSASNAVSLITAPGYFTVAPNEYRDDSTLRIVLAPGTFFVIESNTANNPLRMAFLWYERAIEASEAR